MPMKASRVNRYVKEQKGKIRYDRKLKIHYLQLLVDPSALHTQEIRLGIDPGSTFDGFSIVSNIHHLNVELIQRPKVGRNSIRTFKERQSMNRRTRRCRLRHRKIRHDARTKKRVSPTVKANIEMREWLICKLIKLYPISTVIVEDVKFNHYKSDNGRAFSLAEQGKTQLYSFIKSLNLKLVLRDGYYTKQLRVNGFGVDLKSKRKDEKSFNAHCIDSYVLACPVKVDDKPNFEYVQVNQRVTFIEKIVKIRRLLIRHKKRIRNAKYYYRLLKGGIKEIIPVKYSSKSNICRVKPIGVNSNHPKHWEYLNNGRSLRYKYTRVRYGGTTYKGKSSYKNNEWENRTYEIIR